MRFWLSGKESSSFGWADLVVVPLVVVLSVPGLMFFGRYWTVIGGDSTRYLLAGSQFISGRVWRVLAVYRSTTAATVRACLPW